ncbi:unnamed protein product, partial [Meganyctiphanes norvegica]
MPKFVSTLCHLAEQGVADIWHQPRCKCHVVYVSPTGQWYCLPLDIGQLIWLAKVASLAGTSQRSKATQESNNTPASWYSFRYQSFKVQKSLENSECPEDWRSANVTPIHKKGDRTDPSNYRPMSKYGINNQLQSLFQSQVEYHKDQIVSDRNRNKCKLLITNNITDTSVQSKEPAGKKRKLPDASSENKKISPQLPFFERLSASTPFNFFLNKSFTVKATHNDPFSLVLPDLLNKRLGEIVESAQLSFMVDLDFLMAMYKACGWEDRPLLVMYGQMEGNPRNYNNLTTTRVNLPFQYGTHHTKMMLLQYTAGLRIVIHTANLVTDDWFEKTQGFWVSPVFPPLEGEKSSILDGESPTRFKRDLVDYLQSYKAPDLTRWSHVIRKYDFTACNAIFIGSTPGYHLGEARDKWGHMKVRKAIKQHTPVWKSSVPVIVQCSSIGSLGKDSKTWLSTELGISLTGNAIPTASPPPVKLGYLTVLIEKMHGQEHCGSYRLDVGSDLQACGREAFLRKMRCCNSAQKKSYDSHLYILSYVHSSVFVTQTLFFVLGNGYTSDTPLGQPLKRPYQIFTKSFQSKIGSVFKFIFTSSNSFGATLCPLPVFDISNKNTFSGHAKSLQPDLVDIAEDTVDHFGQSY